MSIGAGSLNRKLVFRRRETLSLAITDPQPPRGGYADYGSAWGSFADKGEDEITISGLTLKARKAQIVIRETSWSRTLTTADRVAVNGHDFAITSISPGLDGLLRINVTQAASRSLYAAEMDQRGEVVTIRRERKNAAAVEARARALVMGYEPNELVSGIIQGARRVFLSAEDLEAQGFPVPPRTGDIITSRSRPLRIETVDESTHRVAGTVNVYLIHAVGA